MMTLVFIDTEFSDFINTELLSMGAVSSRDGSQFYFERNDFDQSKCSEFVWYNIIPLFENNPNNQGSKQQMADALRNWIDRLPAEKVIVVFDYAADWELFCDLLDDNLGEKIDGGVFLQNLCAEAQPNVLVNGIEDYFDQHPDSRHHALRDAMANFAGWKACMGSLGLF